MKQTAPIFSWFDQLKKKSFRNRLKQNNQVKNIEYLDLSELKRNKSKGRKKYSLNIHHQKHGGCEVRKMNPKLGQRQTSPDTGQENVKRQWSGSNSSVMQQELLIYKGNVY